MTKSTITRERLLEIIVTGPEASGAEQNELARMALAAMDSEPHTGDELSNLLWYSQEATCHSDPNYYCEFQRLATPGLIAGIIRELQERRKADSEPVENHIGSKNSLDAIVSFIKSKSNPTVKCYEEVSEQLFKDNCHGIHSHVIEYILKLGEELEDFRAEQAEMPPAQPAADSEPDRNPVLAYADSYRDMAKQGVESVPIWSVITDLERNIAPLYRHAQPAQVVPEEATPDSIEILASGRCRDHVVYQWDEDQRNAAADSWNACRAAMLPAAPVLSSMPDGVVTAEHRRVIEMLLSVCGAAFELADDSCQQDVDGEDCHVVPDDAFQKLSDALDEIENTLPTEDIDRPDVFLAWSAMPRAALKSLLQGGNSPVIPDGYVLVPIEPTEAMCDISHIGVDVYCGITDDNEYYSIGGAEAAKVWKAMLAAAPQEVK